MLDRLKRLTRWLRKARRAEIGVVYDWSTFGLGVVVTSQPGVALIIGPITVEAIKKSNLTTASF